MTRLDWIVLGVVAFTALLGLWQGFVIGALSAAGVILGGFVGARIAPHLLPEGANSPYTPLIALAGAAGGAILFEIVGSSVGTAIRSRVPEGPLRTADSVGGFAFGALAGLALVWILSAVALQLPGQEDLRREVQQSSVLQRLNELVPPQRALRALARVDPFPEIAGPVPPVEQPDSRVLRDPDIRRALPSVVRVLGTACGLGVAGSGWIAAPGLVVTNAHVVAGVDDPEIRSTTGGDEPADTVVFDPKLDIAVLHVQSTPGHPLPLATESLDRGTPGAVLGFPGGGPLQAHRAAVRRTFDAVGRDIYSRDQVERLVVELQTLVRPGNSGGPFVLPDGRVGGVVFAASSSDEDVGYAIAAGEVDDTLRDALGRTTEVDTGPCID